MTPNQWLELAYWCERSLPFMGDTALDEALSKALGFETVEPFSSSLDAGVRATERHAGRRWQITVSNDEYGRWTAMLYYVEGSGRASGTVGTGHCETTARLSALCRAMAFKQVSA